MKINLIFILFNNYLSLKMTSNINTLFDQPKLTLTVLEPLD
jgi:hypothetical protein